ncbi:MAG: hypothetical protein K6348_05005 [Deferribacterales bacterium]
MSKKIQHDQDIPIDQVESFINKNFKKIVTTLIIIIIIGLGIYGVFQYIETGKSAKINQLGEYEVKLNSGEFNEALIEKYISTCENISDLKNYCYYRAGVILAGIGNPKGKEYLKKVSGDYKEFADSVLYDLGEKIDPAQYKDKGKLNYIWKYRMLLMDKKYIASLDNETINTRLITNTKDWE